jgi:RNA polymerase sigma-70 factor (ECF subfamily)
MNEFLMFVEKYKDSLVKSAFHRLGSLEEAEDIVQEVFVKIYTQKIFHKLENPELYFYKMIMNACLDFIRKQKVKFNVYQHFESENQTVSENDAIQNLKIEEEFKRINNILKKLPEEQAEVVRFRIIDELSFKEITAILCEPESTIKSRFQYAIKKLKSYEL